MSTSDRPVFNDRYEIHSRIGRGGMADVFLARDRLLDRPVAVKVLFPEYAADPNFVERFRREATAASNLTHPNIVGVFDFGRQGGTYYMVMEYVNGRTVADILRSDGSLLPQRAADIAADVAAALGFAHRNGVVHRDVKPANILVAPTGTVKVADFGIALALNSATEQDLTQAGAVMGTATYFSPEQAQGAPIDPRSDLYSLGIVMYEMVAGRPPFTGDNPVAIAYKQVHDQPRPLSAIKPDVPRAYEAIVMKLLTKTPQQRYASADDLRADLRRFREGQPVAALAGAPGLAPTIVGQRVGPSGAPTVVAPAVGATQQMRPADATRVAPVTTPPGAGGTGPYQSYDDSPRRTGWYIAGGLLALAVIILGAILLVRAAQDDSGPGKVTMVDVRNQPLTQAQQEVTNLGLKATPVPQENDNVPVNQVFDQSPAPNQQVLKGSEVRLIYNAGRAKVTVPNLVGQTIAQATQTLTALGLPNPQTTQQNSDSQPAGTVLAQDPAPGDVDAGTVVKLTVSGGAAKVDVPNVIGLDQATAANQLGAKGFAVATTQEANQSVEAGKVIRTDPVPGAPLDKGQTVTIVVSTGKPQVDVPDVTTKTESDARNALQAAGFLQNVSYVDVPFGSNQDGKVITQNPPAGTKLAQGSTVSLTVGRALPPPSTTTPATTAAPRITTTSAAGTTTTT